MDLNEAITFWEKNPTSDGTTGNSASDSIQTLLDAARALQRVEAELKKGEHPAGYDGAKWVRVSALQRAIDGPEKKPKDATRAALRKLVKQLRESFRDGNVIVTIPLVFACDEILKELEESNE